MSENKNLIALWSNDKKRREFLETYKDWGVWLTTPELELVYYRYQLSDGTIIIAMEHKKQIFVSYQEGYKWGIGVNYYIQKLNEPFTPTCSSISAVAELLKDIKTNLQKN